MKKERQIGLRVSLPAFFLMELEEYYKRSPGAHRAMKLNNFAGYLLGLGLEQYRKGTAAPPKPEQEEAPEERDEEKSRPIAESLHLFDINPAGLPDLFREFDEAMKPRGLRLVHAGEDREEDQQC
jgi:hypothetical protein